MPEPTIIFIAAHSRSGSTLLDRALGQENDFLSMGEIRYIWRRGIIENQLCGCGRPFSTCDFWQEVIRDAFGTISIDEAEHIDLLFRQIHSASKLPMICWPQFRSQIDKVRHKEWGAIVTALFRSTAKIGSARYLVDSSKAPSYGLLLNQALATERFFTVHLIRDSRAVAFSRIRKKKRPEVHWKKDFMGITPPYKTAGQWSACNLLCELLAKRSKSLKVRYEDFISTPQKGLTSLVKQITGEQRILNYIDGPRITLDSAHTASGNPMRFKTGPIDLLADMEWRESLDLTDRMLVSLISWPLLVRYAYYAAHDSGTEGDL